MGKAFADGDATCGSGYYHGLLQWKLAGVAADQVSAIASTVCKDATIEANAFIYYQCNHGLGHGLMLYTALRPAEGARLLPQAADRGGLDHVQRRSLHGEPELVVRPPLEVAEQEEPALPLQQQARGRSDKLYCYLLITSHILPYVHGSWTKTADWCRKSDPGWVQYCFQSMGRDVSGPPSTIRSR